MQTFFRTSTVEHYLYGEVVKIKKESRTWKFEFAYPPQIIMCIRYIFRVIKV